MSNNYKILIDKLDAFIRKYYRNRLLKGLIYCFSLLFASFIIFTSVEYFGQFNTVGRTVLFYTFIATTLYLFINFVIIPLSKLYKFGKVISHDQAADIIGKHFEEVKDKLINVLQLEHLSSLKNDQLLLASIEQKSLELNPIPFTSAVNIGENKKYLKYLAIPVFVIIGITLISPNVFKEGTNRLVNHNVYMEPIAPFQFILDSRKLDVLKNKDYSLMVSVNGNQLPNKVYLEQNGNKYPLTKTGSKSYAYTFKNVQDNQKFKIYASGFYSRPYELNVIPNPILSNFSIDINYPKYLSRTDETLYNTGDLLLPEGTKIKWNIQTEDADFLNFIVGDSSYQLTSVNEKVSLYRVANKNLSYSFVPSNRFVIGSDTVSYFLQVIKDKFPTIKVDEKKDSLNENRIYFKGEITDDYGFSGLTFNYQVLAKKDSLESKNETKSVKIPINYFGNLDEFFHVWNMEDINILPGDEIMYYFEVFDNDGVNGRKSTKTSLKTFKSKSIEERDFLTESTNKNIKKDLLEGVKEAKQLQKNLEDFRKKLTDKKQLDWEEKERLKELLEKQKSLEERVKNIQEQNEKNNLQQNEYKQLNEDILEKQELLQKLFDELVTDEMKEMMDKLQEMMDKLDKGLLEQELEKMDLSNKDLEKELDRSLELFKQMEFDQKLDDVKSKLDDLAEKQEQLSESTKEKKENNEELKQQQEELNKEFDELKKEMKELREMDNDLENPNGMENTKEKENEVDEEMQKSTDQLEEKKNKKASDSQKSAAEKMKEMSQQMAGMQSQESQQEDMDALRQLLDNLLHLSFEQEDLMEDYKKVDRKSPKYVEMAQQQKKLKDDAKMIEDSLFALSKRVFQLESTINKEISSINSNMDKTIELMAERLNPLAVSRQQYVMTSVNNLALLFDEALQQMQQQAQSKPGSGSCDKPGGNGQPKPGIGSIKKMQKKLSDQLKAMEKALKEGKKQGGKKPGQQDGLGLPGGKGMSESLAKMAAQQAKIRSELEKLKKAGAKGTNGLSKLMEENEKDIVNKRITQRTIDRQKQILTRLLESEKAEMEREWDDKRESKEGKKQEKGNPELFFEYNGEKNREVDLIKTTPPNLNVFYKQKVTEYFQNKNR